MWNAMQEKTESDMLNSESKSELSFRVNGWRQRAYSGSPLELKSDIKGIEIRTLADFCSKLNELNGISENPFFYRGHNNLNYILIPGIMRTGMKNEHLLFNEFGRLLINYYETNDVSEVKEFVYQNELSGFDSKEVVQEENSKDSFDITDDFEDK